MSAGSISTAIERLRKHFGDKPIKVIEIGAQHGNSSMTILTRLNVEQYYIVDPYTFYDDYEKDGFGQILKSSGGDKIMEGTKNKLKKFPVEFVRKFSDDAHSDFEDESIDLIFVDANHEYQYVLNDIKNYFPKVKTGGIICGDDYFMRNHSNDWNNVGNQYPRDMVYEAVQEFYTDTDYTIEEFGRHSTYAKTWLVVK